MIGGIHKYDDNKRTVLKSMIVNPQLGTYIQCYIDNNFTTLEHKQNVFA